MPTTIKLNSVGADVQRWQRILDMQPSGTFDHATEAATRAWQTTHGLNADGIVGPLTWEAAAIAAGGSDYPFIQARNYTKGRLGSPVALVVIHTMEAPEKPKTARNVARWFAGDTAPKASAHYCIDASEIIQCVSENDTAWAAPGANRNGIHLEHAGYSAQSPSGWDDAYSTAMLERSAALTARICKERGIPIRKLAPADLVAGAAGLCGHVDVTNAFHKSDHTDPGGQFPWTHYLDLVMAATKEAAEEETNIA